MKKIKSKKIYYKIKIVMLLILWCISTSFMSIGVNSFFGHPDVARFVSSIPLIYASYKCITEVVKNAFIIIAFEYLKK